MLLDPRLSLLLIVDVQERLVPAVQQTDQLIEACAWLVRLARELKIPVRLSEQYPRGLGPTVSPLRDLLEPEQVLEKVHFSCVAEPNCREAIDETGREQIIVAGIEAHVCVLQTVLNLLEQGKQVFVVADAVSSRAPENAQLGIERMRQAGAQIVTREMVFFEWLKKAGTEQFRALSKQYVR